MAGEHNLETAKEGYQAFMLGDAETALENIHDDVEWIVPGNSAVSGTLRGKQEVGEFWGVLAEKGFQTSPQYWFCDDERVVVLTQIKLDGKQADHADVLTFREGKVAKFQTAADTALFEQVFGRK